MRKLINFLKRLNYIQCKCGCRTQVSKNEILLDTYGPVCEYELRCAKCDAVVNYWAYGYLQYPETYTELFKYKLFSLKQRFVTPSFSVHKDLPKC